ncbi:MAG: ABC transporter ATP-binding protein [Saprospiraceae bacterium]|nr:ABC transporter ATP-binding protein [Saprospiraceae bacterium]
MTDILSIQNLSVEFKTEQKSVHAVKNLNLNLKKGEVLGIVGESGSGKSVTALSIMRLLTMPPAAFSSGKILFQKNAAEIPIDLIEAPEKTLQTIRGKEIAMIFQEPMTSLNPVIKCGHQITEAIQIHQKISYKSSKELTLRLFESVKLPNPERIFNAYPHQISGGQKQRVMIAMAISCQPTILIADEPTTALDVTVQKSILELLKEIRETSGLSMIFISHDLGVIYELCDRVAVMYQGELVEEGLVQEVFQHPVHPYTKGLIACRPSLKHKLNRLPTIQQFLDNDKYDVRVINSSALEKRRNSLLDQQPLIKIESLRVKYPDKKNVFGITTSWLHSVDDVSFDIYPGETFGLAGESGCGKTTLGRSIARLTSAQAGRIFYNDVELLSLSEPEFLPYRKAIQVVFQDPYSSLNPRMTIGNAIAEPMEVHRLHGSATNRKAKTIELLETVGLSADQFNRYPHEFSGGQRQRICLARALALEPQFLVCDEMVSALDVSVQATILNLLMDLQEKFGLTYLFISHDLSVIKQMCDRLLIMKDGKQEGLGIADDLFENPPTEYVKKLIKAIPGQS